MVDEVQHVPEAGPRVLAPAPPRAGHRVLRTTRVSTALALLAAAVIVAGGSLGEGVGVTLVRIAFASLWLAVPWLVTEGAAHLVRRGTSARPAVAGVAGAAWVLAVGAVSALTPTLVRSPASASWGLAGAAVAAAVLVVGVRFAPTGRPRADEDPTAVHDPDAWRRGPFID